MKEISKEINAISAEIKQKTPNIEELVKSLQKDSTRGQKITVGFNWFELEGLRYAFMRFYPFANQEELSKDSVALFQELTKTREEQKKLTEDVPKELEDFLNK